MSDEKPFDPETFGRHGNEILLSLQRVVCPVHGEPLRPHWLSVEVMGALIEMFQAVTANASLLDAVRAATGVESPEGHHINAVTEKRPLCYFATREQLRAMYATAEIGRIGVCVNCRRSGLGGVCTWSAPLPTDGFICFDCILAAGRRLHRAHPLGRVW